MSDDQKTDSHTILQDAADKHEEQPGEVTTEKPSKKQTAEMQADDRSEKKVNPEG